MNYAELELTLDDIRSIGLTLLEDGLQDYSAVRNGVEKPTERLILLTSFDEEERIERLRVRSKKLGSPAPASGKAKPPARLTGKLAGMEKLLRRLDKPKAPPRANHHQQEPVGLEWLRAVHEFTSDLRQVASDGKAEPRFRISGEKEDKITIEPPDTDLRAKIQKALDRDLRDIGFVAAVMDACMNQRAQTKGACSLSTAEDEIALTKAYLLLDQGVRLPKVIKPLHKSAHREHQTYLSFADPGPGHLKGTVRNSDLLAGTIVHIEWIDRDNVDDKSVVEAYRLPALRSAARVRLHVGDETPCSVFIGRPVFEGARPEQWMTEADFGKALLKAAHTMASTCSAMFALGVVDCKVAMDGLTTSQAVAFMLAVAGNVVRESGIQMLSAAFNINTPLREDRPEIVGTEPRMIINSVEVARLGIDLVCAGRFDKIAWDGASNRQPSLPIISQLTMPKLLDLVHQAHQAGLETYISAGLESEHMRWAVYTGVGGVGIGTSLHHVNPDGKLVGEINPALVLETLSIRNIAAKNGFGQAAAALARLDWRAHERSLSKSLDETRRKLYDLLQDGMAEFEGRLHEAIALKTAAKDEKSKPLRAVKEKKLQDRLAEWTDRERKTGLLDALVKTIGQIEEAEAKAAFKLALPGMESFGGTDIHPLIERAERTLVLHDSGSKAAFDDGWNGNMLTALRTALANGRVDLLSDLFAQFDERHLY